MKTSNTSLNTPILALLASALLSSCATPPPNVSAASLAGAKRVAVVNLTQAEPLMMGGRYDPSGGTNGLVGAGPSGLLAGLVLTGAGASWASNRKEFNDSAPAGLALDLQRQFTQLMQKELVAPRRETVVVEIEPPTAQEKNTAQLLAQSIRTKCATCDYALMVSPAFGYSQGDRILNPTAQSTYQTVRLADATVTGFTRYLVYRDHSNNASGHENYNEFRQDKRDHYAPLRDLPAAMVRAIAKELR
jgi:hypothetical protein